MGFFDSLRAGGVELGTLVGIILCVILALVVLYLLVYGLVYLLMKPRKQAQQETRVAGPDNEAVLRREIAAIRVQAEEQVKRTHQEIEDGLQRFNDAMVRLVGEVQRTQQSQLDSFGGQLRAVSRVEEERMDKMSEAMSRQFTGYDQRMQQITQVLDAKLEIHEAQVQHLQKALESGMAQMRVENARRLEELRANLDAQTRPPMDRSLGESFQQVNAQLEQVQQGLSEVHRLTGEADDMEQVLASIQPQGPWGEVQLSSLLSRSLAPEQYAADVQVSPDEAIHVPFAVILPAEGEGVRYLPLDDACPLTDYRRLMEAVGQGDAAAMFEAGATLADALRVAAKHTGDTYIRPPHTTDYAVLFLPAEGMYAEALRVEGLVDELTKQYRVLLAGPTTLTAMLLSLRAGFRTRAIERRTDEVWQLLDSVKREFGGFSALLAATQQKLGQASESIEAATRNTRNIQRNLRGGNNARAEAALLGASGEGTPAVPAAKLKRVVREAPEPVEVEEDSSLEGLEASAPVVDGTSAVVEAPRSQPVRQIHEEDFYSDEDEDLLEDWS